jgi:drug/metabolite transporter (DMT)-like permease
MPLSGKPYLQIHLCVLLWGFTAILGKLISLPAVPLVFWRMLIVCACLAMWPPLWKKLAGVPPRAMLACCGIGLLVTLHWLCFYASIKLANASVAATCMALAPVFLALLEPRLAGRRFNGRELTAALLAVPGVAMVVGGIPSTMREGFWLGVLSALLAALFSIGNKRLAMKLPALAITALEMATGAIALVLLLPLWSAPGAGLAWPNPDDAALLLALAIACTLLPFALSLVALRHISAFSAMLAVNLEPVYAIFLAAILLGEQRQLDVLFYFGVATILGAVLAHAWWQRGTTPMVPPFREGRDN